MELLGTQYIGYTSSASGKETFSAVDPRTGEPHESQFYEALEEEISQAAEACRRSI